MNPLIKQQIAESGLLPEDLDVREASSPELNACGVPTDTPGYVIPYYDINGKPLPFYRIRFFNYTPKYKQPRNSANHVYYPKGFLNALAQIKTVTDVPFIMITEGERKAAAAVKNGIPCIGLGGVDSWRTRTVNLPEGTSFTAATQGKKKWTQAKLPSTATLFDISQITFSVGLSDLVQLIKEQGLYVLLCFDSDISTGLKFEVQRACWSLGCELRYQGIELNNIKQVILPYDTASANKTAIDDFLLLQGKRDFLDLIYNTIEEPSGFPRHPDPRSYITNRLEKGKLKRREAQELAMTTLVELDAHGSRLRDTNTKVPYYFDELSKKLMHATLASGPHVSLAETDIGVHLYKNFGISSSDQKMLGWLATQYTGEEPVQEVDPVKVMTQLEDKTFGEIAVQLSDSQFAVVTGDPKHPIKICSNGTRGVLFLQGQVKEMDTAKLIREIQKQLEEPPSAWYRDVLETINMRGKHSRDYMTLLLYASPFLSRWKGTQLPVEILCGEAGSGKSSLYALRLSILTGIPLLRNIPTDLRDWHSGISSTGGLYVTDNVQFTDKNLRQRLSDEICRIITEPHPHVEMRRLYTTATQLLVPVHTTFAFTAIQQPFLNADLLQRAAVFEIEALAGDNFDGNWLNHTMESRGGREAWFAHQLIVLHRFFKLANAEWDPNKRASHRLAHFEQCMFLLGKTLGIDTSFLKEELVQRTVETIASSDWTMQGIKEFTLTMRDGNVDKPFNAADIAQWAEYNEEYSNNTYLKSSRHLGSYMMKHKSDIQKVCNVVQLPQKQNNRVMWSLI